MTALPKPLPNFTDTVTACADLASAYWSASMPGFPTLAEWAFDAARALDDAHRLLTGALALGDDTPTVEPVHTLRRWRDEDGGHVLVMDGCDPNHPHHADRLGALALLAEQDGAKGYAAFPGVVSCDDEPDVDAHLQTALDVIDSDDALVERLRGEFEQAWTSAERFRAMLRTSLREYGLVDESWGAVSDGKLIELATDAIHRDGQRRRTEAAA